MTVTPDNRKAAEFEVLAIKQDGIHVASRFRPETGHDLVRVEWLEVAGDRCWSSSGTGDAKREAVTAIERIEEMCESMH